MTDIKEESLDELPVPINTSFDFNIGPFSFELKRLIEGIIVAGLLCGGLYLITTYLISIPWNYLITAYLFALAAGVYAGVSGINGDSITGYILNMIKFQRKKRVTHYSPRVKSEKRYFTEDVTDDDYVIPRERLEALYHKYVDRNETEIDSIFREEVFDTSTMFFEDDIEVLGKPEELMSKGELRKLARAKKKEAKRQIKLAKKQQKEALKQQKLEKKARGKQNEKAS